MKFVFSYDLQTGTPHPHEYFLAAAQIEGMLFVISSGTNVVRLPNTTLWGEFADVKAATAAFNRALAITSAVVGYVVALEKRAITKAGTIASLSDRSMPRNPAYTAGGRFNTALLHQENERLFALPKAVVMRVKLERLKRLPARR